MSRCNRIMQNPTYLAFEIKICMQDETWSESDSGYMKVVAFYRNRIYKLKNYEDELPFNRRTCLGKSASPRPPADRHDTTARPPFQFRRRKRLNRQHGSLSFVAHLKTDVAILAYQREAAVLDDRQQMLLQARRCAGIARQEPDDPMRINYGQEHNNRELRRSYTGYS